MSRICAILIAAGESTRMGRPKPLLAWHGTTLLEYQVDSLVEGGADEVIVVLGHDAESLAPYVKGACVRYVVNPDYREGKTTSIKAGVGAT
ncbi:MAG: NTP transferase domain-containing protein, partial [Chloroflexi bacterium]|nr:NTP transferase domain-containing protein [Chloroflexota bacterium]